MASNLPTVLLAACVALLAIAAPLLAGDPDMLQDICVADYRSLLSSLRVNGYPCKREATVTADEFFFIFGGQEIKANDDCTRNSTWSTVTVVDVNEVPGLNTLGVSMASVEYAPCGGVNPPHTHPRATEIIFVVEGTLEVGFITTANRLFNRTVPKGGVFVFPRGLLHYEPNIGRTPAVAISAFNSQLPGTQMAATALFGAAPEVPTDVLVRAFQTDGGVVEAIKSNFSSME